MSAVWHPFHQHATEPQPPLITAASGATLTTADGRTLIDAISSWWVTTHGHAHPPIMQAIREATGRLDQVIFAGLTHPAAEAVAEGLVALAPAGLTRVFFSDSGSTAVEVALKMALGFWVHTGRPRHRIAVLESSYHGDTIGTMSVGERGVFNAPYAPLMFDVSRLPFPEGDGAATVAALETLAAQGDLAALIVEPLVLGAGGMRMYPAAILARLAEVARAHEVLLIADEVMTGWGRTGTLWACDQAGVAPDILCTSKGLTGGSLPLAATLASEPIFAAHYSPDRARTFFHSSSYTANPIACAAALANLAVWQAEPVAQRITTLAERQAGHLAALGGDPRFDNPRQCGTIAAIDLKVDAAGYLAAAGPRLRAHAMTRGVLLRPLGNTVYVLPPYCITEAQLAEVWAAVASFEV